MSGIPAYYSIMIKLVLDVLYMIDEKREKKISICISFTYDQRSFGMGSSLSYHLHEMEREIKRITKLKNKILSHGIHMFLTVYVM